MKEQRCYMMEYRVPRISTSASASNTPALSWVREEGVPISMAVSWLSSVFPLLPVGIFLCSLLSVSLSPGVGVPSTGVGAEERVLWVVQDGQFQGFLSTLVDISMERELALENEMATNRLEKLVGLVPVGLGRDVRLISHRDCASLCDSAELIFCADLPVTRQEFCNLMMLEKWSSSIVDAVRLPFWRKIRRCSPFLSPSVPAT